MSSQNENDDRNAGDIRSQSRSEEPSDGGRPERGIVRLQKNIVFDETIATHFDEKLINPQFYNGFNYSLLPNDRLNGRIVLGVTSPNPGDGKTVVAANLAVSMAHSTDNEVMLMDMNVHRPMIHQLFSISRKPGLMEALSATSIRVSATRIRNLSILTLGDVGANALQGIRLNAGETRKSSPPSGPPVRLEDLSEFRNVLHSLEEKFDLIIVDLPSMKESTIPTLFMRQLSGVLVVVNAGQTKRGDLDRLFKQIDASQVVGLVFNHARPDHTY